LDEDLSDNFNVPIFVEVYFVKCESDNSAND